MPLPIFPYQEAGADWIARRERCGLLDETGLGKTADIIRALDLRRVKRGIIISPAHLRENWRAEFEKFAYVERRVIKAKTIDDFMAWARGVHDVLLVGYEMAVKWAPLIQDMGELLDFIDLDEAHYLKNLSSQRSKFLLGAEGNGNGGVTQWSVQSRWITGTLNPNDPADCYSFLRFCRATQLSESGFARRYFHTHLTTWGQRNKPRKETLPELQALIANNSIRRTFASVGHELPPIFMTTAVVDGDTEAIRAMLGATPSLSTAIVEALEEGGLSFLDNQHVATLRRLIAEAKALPYAEMLLDELAGNPDRKVVVMGISRDALIFVQNYLAARNVGAVLLIGGVSDKQREQHMIDFQKDSRCRVFIGNMRAAGVGYTLTAAAHIDILESDWAPAGNAQAIARIRRLGQSRNQHARFITLARSLDEVVNRIVAEKTAAIAMLDRPYNLLYA